MKRNVISPQASERMDVCLPSNVIDLPWGRVRQAHPGVMGFFRDRGFIGPDDDETMGSWVAGLDSIELDDQALSRAALIEAFEAYFDEISVSGVDDTDIVRSLTIAGGCGKNGMEERATVDIRAGEVVAVVGPTGSGKSRLLCDIECLAQGDTPSKRIVRVNGDAPSELERFSAAHKLVAQLSQSMNYVLELTVSEFLHLHACSRGVSDVDGSVASVVSHANELCGEPFDGSVPVCALSGGQSRALMIADVALISSSPIVLVDELENAGVDKGRALDLLVRKGKVVLMATHDPLLMLMCPRRIVMAKGSMMAVVARSECEATAAKELEDRERRIDALRNHLRAGGRIEEGSSICDTSFFWQGSKS